MLQQAHDLAIDLARKAGEIQLVHVGKKHHLEYKGEINIVTEVDRECESLIVSGITKIFPDHDILAEEGSGKRTSSPCRWIIDPIDGTVNYAHGFPFYGVSIALEQHGHIVLGVIYDPNRDEMFVAQKGKGAFLGKECIHVSTASILRQSLLATGFAYGEGEIERNMANFSNFLRTARAVRRPGSAAIDLAWVACGRLDGFWEFSLQPWDMAAGILIVEEAGGKVSSLENGPFDLYGDEVLASNGNIHNEMVNILQHGITR